MIKKIQISKYETALILLSKGWAKDYNRFEVLKNIYIEFYIEQSNDMLMHMNIAHHLKDLLNKLREKNSYYWDSRYDEFVFNFMNPFHHRYKDYYPELFNCKTHESYWMKVVFGMLRMFSDMKLRDSNNEKDDVELYEYPEGNLKDLTEYLPKED